MRVEVVRNLHKVHGCYARTVGLFRPRVQIDPLTDTARGGVALVCHEAVHVQERHALVGILVLILSGGLAYKRWRIRCETRADCFAYWKTTDAEFRAMCHMHPHPKSKWGKALYCKDIEARVARAKEGTWKTKS